MSKTQVIMVYIYIFAYLAEPRLPPPRGGGGGGGEGSARNESRPCKIDFGQVRACLPVSMAR